MDPRATASRSPEISRRVVLRSTAVGAVAVPLLAACGDGDDPQSTTSAGDPTTAAPGSTGPSAGAGAGSGSGDPQGDVLAKTSDIEVGGAVFLEDPSVVVTQPAEGEFHAFDRKCTHAQCPVTDIRDGKIHCRCHDSLYDMATGENVGGPAPSPLTEIQITVENGEVLQA